MNQAISWIPLICMISKSFCNSVRQYIDSFISNWFIVSQSINVLINSFVSGYLYSSRLSMYIFIYSVTFINFFFWKIKTCKSLPYLSWAIFFTFYSTKDELCISSGITMTHTYSSSLLPLGSKCVQNSLASPNQAGEFQHLAQNH